MRLHVNVQLIFYVNVPGNVHVEVQVSLQVIAPVKVHVNVQANVHVNASKATGPTKRGNLVSRICAGCRIPRDAIQGVGASSVG